MTTTDHATRPPPPAWTDPMVIGPEPVPAAGRWRPLLVWFACLGAAIAALQWLGAGPLAVPPVTEPTAWWAWATTNDPLVVAMALVRVLGLGLAWYLTGVTSISVVARLLRAARLLRLADALAVGPVRVLAQQAVGVGLAAGVVAAAFPGEVAAPTGSPDGPAAVVVAEAAEDATAPTPPVSRARVPVPVPAPGPPPPRDVATTATQGGSTPASEAVPATPPADPVDPARADAGAPPAAAGPRERVVAPGDHFWGIAEEEVAAHLGRPGTEREVRHHWRRLVEANADRLVARGNPDLLLPGQHVVLPPVTP